MTNKQTLEDKASTNKVLKKVATIKELLSQEHPRFLCATSEIKYFDHLGEECLKEYATISDADKADSLLQYLKEALTKLQTEEYETNQQVALLLCGAILRRPTGTIANVNEQTSY